MDLKTNPETTNKQISVKLVRIVQKIHKNSNSQFRNWLLDPIKKIKKGTLEKLESEEKNVFKHFEK